MTSYQVFVGLFSSCSHTEEFCTVVSSLNSTGLQLGLEVGPLSAPLTNHAVKCLGPLLQDGSVCREALSL